MMLSKTQIGIYDKINKYLQTNVLTLEKFWNTKHVCVTIQQFNQMLTLINLQITQQQIIQLQKQNLQFITLEKVIKNIPIWQKNYQSVGDFFIKTSRIQKSISNSQKQQQSSQRKVNQSMNSVMDRYLIQHKKKQQKNQMNLNYTLIRTKNETDYDLTIKIGEANDICKILKKQLVYSVISTEKGIEIYQQNKKDNSNNKIKEKEFLKKYQSYKQEHNNKVEVYEGTLEQNLKEVLVEVMCLSEELERQIKIIQSKGITH